jgi:hypothetical protein
LLKYITASLNSWLPILDDYFVRKWIQRLKSKLVLVVILRVRVFLYLSIFLLLHTAKQMTPSHLRFLESWGWTRGVSLDWLWHGAGNVLGFDRFRKDSDFETHLFYLYLYVLFSLGRDPDVSSSTTKEADVSIAPQRGLH